MEHDDVDTIGSEANNAVKRLKEMEDESAALREMQAKVEKEMSSVQDPGSAVESQVNREEVDSRSVFVGNVTVKRTNIPGLKQHRPCRSIHGSRSRSPYVAAPHFFPPFGYRFETSPHVVNSVTEAIEGMRVALGAAVVLNYCLQGLFPLARKV